MYYNPENPQISTLIAGAQKSADKTANNIGTALVLGGTVLIIVFLGRTIMIFSRAAGKDKPKGKRQKG